MTFDPDQCMKIKATGKCDEDWYYFSSKNPIIASGMQETLSEARDKYEENLKSYLEKRWGILPEQVIRYETKTRAVSVWFVDKEDLHTARVNLEDLRTTITYCIQEQKNRTLSEFEALETAANELKNYLDENKMTMEVSLSGASGEISQRVKQISDLAAQKAGEEA